MLKWKSARALALALFVVLPLSFGGCEVSCDSDRTPIEEAADSIEDAAENVGDAIEDAGDGS